MIWRRGRRYPAPRVAEDGVDDQLWEYLVDMIVAVHDGDLATFHARIRLLSDYLAQPDVHGEPGVMMTYLIKYRTSVLLGGRTPTPADLSELAAARYEPYHRIMEEAVPLYAVLTSAWGLASKDMEIRGNQYILACLGTLGALLDDPRPQLAETRPPMATWYRRNMVKYRPGVDG